MTDSRKSPYEKKNGAAHDSWKQSNKEKNASKGKQVWKEGKWVRSQSS